MLQGSHTAGSLKGLASTTVKYRQYDHRQQTSSGRISTQLTVYLYLDLVRMEGR